MFELPAQYHPSENLMSGQRLRDWFSENYATLEDGGYRYLGGEPNTMDPSLFDSADIRILILRMSTYDAMDGSMTHSLVAQTIRDEVKKNGKTAFTDFAFLPPRKDYEIFQKTGIPLWVPVSSKRAPKDFDIIFISHSVCLEMCNYPKLAIKSGLPLFKNQRMGRDDIPLLVWGGAHAVTDETAHGSFDPDGEFHSFSDAVVIGDGEPAIKTLMQIYFKQGPFDKTSKSKQRFLRACHKYKVPGFYEPDKYTHTYVNARLSDIRPNVDYVDFPVKKSKVWNLDTVRTLEERVQWYSVSLGGTADIEIARGCGAHCTFCMEASVSRPYRERSLSKVKEAAWESRFYQGALEINLFSFVWNQYSRIYPLAQWLLEKFGRCNLISNRLDMQAEDKIMARMAKAMGSNHLTVGLEGASERMRNLLNKNLSHQQVLQGCRNIFAAGIAELKLFMIATGSENDDDLAEFERLLEDIIAIRNEEGSTATVRVSFTPLFHCGKTVLQYGKCQTVKRLDERTLDRIVQKCRDLGVGFRTSTKKSEVFLGQLTEMADRRLTPLYVKSSIDDGYIYYGFVSKDTHQAWVNRMAEYGYDPDYYFLEKGQDYVFAWDGISTGLSNQYLWEVYKEVTSFQEREYCVATLSKRGTCTSCQACETPLQIAELTNRKMSDPIDNLFEHTRPLVKASQIRFKMSIDPAYRTVPKKFYPLSIGRALVQAHPFFLNHYNQVLAHSRSGPSSDGSKDWTNGIMLMDVSVDSTISEATVQSLIPEMNKRLKGWQIIDARVLRSMESIPAACELALYEINIPASVISFYDLDKRIEAYFAASTVKFRKKVQVGKNIFKTEIIDLDKTAVVAVEAFFTGEETNRVVFSATAKLNPFALLESLLGGRAHNYRKFPVNCLGYYSIGQKDGSADIFAVLMGKTNLCKECNASIENDVFTGESYKGSYGEGLCISCDISRQPANLKAPELVHVTA